MRALPPPMTCLISSIVTMLVSPRTALQQSAVRDAHLNAFLWRQIVQQAVKNPLQKPSPPT